MQAYKRYDPRQIDGVIIGSALRLNILAGVEPGNKRSYGFHCKPFVVTV